MVIDKELWQRKSVETVNLIIDDAMPAVVAMVHDYVGPLNIADADVPARATMPSAAPMGGVKADAAAKPVLGRTEATESLPPEVGVPAPPDSVQLDLPAAAETDHVAVPGPPVPSPVTNPVTSPVTSPVSKPASAGLPPMVLAPEKAPAAAAKAADAKSAPLPAKPSRPPQPAAKSMITEDAGKEPTPLTAPSPPETMSGIQPAPRDTPLRWGKPSFLIRTVEGAPGDGNRALATAITAALRGKDLTVTEDPRQAGYEVVGKVDVGPPVNGRQRARITWAVNTIGGQEVGKAVQENVVAAGSLDGSWGQVAVLVTSAAASAVQQLFEAPRPKYTPVGAVPDFPKIPNLPRVPGRALPPPS